MESFPTREADVVARFDAGIHFMEFVAQDMIAVRVPEDLRPAIVGSPDYFASHPKPVSPRQLLGHRCINFRCSFAESVGLVAERSAVGGAEGPPGRPGRAHYSDAATQGRISLPLEPPLSFN
jgi:hypothetical protein